MDSDDELRLTIMATLAQEESRKKITVTQSKGTVLFISVVLPTLLRQLLIGAVRGWRPA